MRRPYWETENPVKVIRAGRQQFSYYRQAGILEVTTIVEKDGSQKPIRTQAIFGDRLKNNDELVNMLLEFLQDVGVVQIEDV